VRAFAELLAEHRAMFANGVVASDIVKSILERSGLLEDLRGSSDPQAAGRLENLEQLVTLAAEFVAEANGLVPGAVAGGAATEPAAAEFISFTPSDDSLAAFLERIALASDTDQMPDSGDGVVTLLTLHAAKGLEYDDVFIAGLEEGLFPHARSIDDPEAAAEERRLAYVGLTRARKRLHLSFAQVRLTWGTAQANPPSRFVSDIPERLLSWVRKPGGRPGYGDGRRRGAGWRVPGDDWGEPEGRVFGGGSSFGGASQAGSSGGSRGGPATAAPFAVGERVSHDAFGLGKVTEVGGKPGEQQITVDFGSAGVKRLAVRFAPLERL
jgi:DNA helicase-2/ATP-dependent DNA helicase PcrA